MRVVDVEGAPGAQLKMWTEGVQVEQEALNQLERVAGLPIVAGHVAVMPDVHWGMGATVGSVIPTVGAIIPAAVGVDIGCGMIALETMLRQDDLPDSRGLKKLREGIERAIPVGGPGKKGSWEEFGRYGTPGSVSARWGTDFAADWLKITTKHPKLAGTTFSQLGTLGTGNHFIEVCVAKDGLVWLVLHSGSRGLGNRVGMYFIEKARQQATRDDIHLPDKDLAWLSEDTQEFRDYVEALGLAQRFAYVSRSLMMDRALKALRDNAPAFQLGHLLVNCHHNYVAQEAHFGNTVWLTRKGAVDASLGRLGIIPGSMGAATYIVLGKGNPESYNSCSHGAGRRMSRTQARKQFTVAEHEAATWGVECRKDNTVLDETPGAYKDIDEVMAAQADLVEVVHTLKQVVCVKG